MIIKKSNSFDDALPSRPFLDSELDRRPPFKLPFFLTLFLSVCLSIALALSLYSVSSLRSLLVQQQQAHESQIQQIQQSSYEEGYQEGYHLGHTQGIVDEKKTHNYYRFASEFKKELNFHLQEKFEEGYSAGYDDCKNGKTNKYNPYQELYQEILEKCFGKK